MIYAAFILLIAAVLFCRRRDYKDGFADGHINHTKAWKVKALTCIPSVTLFTIYLTSAPFSGLDIFLASGKSILLTGAWFMFLFNAAWGWMVARDPFYRSTAVGKSLPWSDKIFLRWPRWLYILFMVLLVSGATILYFL